MAEGWAKHLKATQANFYSAGIETHGLNPNAVRVMAEAGVDISSHQSQTVDELGHILFDQVIAVCEHAHQNCPAFKGNANPVAVCFDDPPKLARDAATEQEALDQYRRVRDEIKQFVSQLHIAWREIT